MPRYTHLLLDLDDTLYPDTSGVWEAVRDRIQHYIVTRLSVSEDEATLLRQRYLAQYGTTLTGLSEEFEVDVEEYLDYVHDVPMEQLLKPNSNLKRMLQQITVPRIIFTNAYHPHAERVLNQLGVAQEIDQIIDIYALDFQNKPKAAAYERALRLISADDPSRVVFVDDRLSNLEPAAMLKIVTIKVGQPPDSNTHLHIEHITDLVNLLPELLNPPTEHIDA